MMLPLRAELTVHYELSELFDESRFAHTRRSADADTQIETRRGAGLCSALFGRMGEECEQLVGL